MDAAGEAFEAIRSLVSGLSGRVVGVADDARQLETGAQVVLDGVASVAAVSEENASASQQVAAATADSLVTSQQVAASAGELRKAISELSSLVARFRVE